MRKIRLQAAVNGAQMTIGHPSPSLDFVSAKHMLDQLHLMPYGDCMQHTKKKLFTKCYCYW